ncbi:MAG: HAMP domain-containing sensor histidine kinase [Nitrospinota bacterium]
MIENLYIFLIFGGLIIIASLLYLRRLVSTAVKTTFEIIDLNVQLSHDPHQFVNEVFPLLRKTQIIDFSYKITYPGTEFERKKTTRRKGISKSLTADDYTIYIEIVPRTFKGEIKYIYALILETLFLLIKTDLLIKIKTLNDTFANIAKLQTFIQHDIKNIAQFVQTLSFNLQNIMDHKDEQRLVSYLKESSSGLLLRANKIISTLEINSEKEDEPEKKIDIKKSIESLIKSYNLSCSIKGNASVYGPESRIFLIFDNIFKNIYDKSLQESLECDIEICKNDNGVTTSIFDTGSEIKDIEKIFEPFYTSKSSGLGVGLYQVKNIVTRMGGKINVENTGHGVRFDITIPEKLSIKSESTFKIPNNPHLTSF